MGPDRKHTSMEALNHFKYGKLDLQTTFIQSTKAYMKPLSEMTKKGNISPRITELAHGWRPPRGGKRAQRDSALKLIVIHFAKIQNWGRC